MFETGGQQPSSAGAQHAAAEAGGGQQPDSTVSSALRQGRRASISLAKRIAASKVAGLRHLWCKHGVLE